MSLLRQQQRAAMLAKRAKLSRTQRKTLTKQINQQLKSLLMEMTPGNLALYWPIKGELSCLNMAPELLQHGWQLSLPVMNIETKTLQFAHWTPDSVMVKGHWNIPVPADPVWLQPDNFLIPLVGFDAQFYRLGYGGGYYDRTLAQLTRPACCIGIGIDAIKIPSIEPHHYDIPMDIIVTESGTQRRHANAM